MLQLLLELQHELAHLLEFDASFLALDLELDGLFKRRFYLVRSELGKAFLEEVDFELDVEVLFLEAVDVLQAL